MKSIPFHLLTVLLLVSPLLSQAEFAWTDTEGKHLELSHDGAPVARYVYEAIDESTPERREETYKPFCHVYRPGSSEDFLTKGPGGKFTHHRGIYYGFSKVSYTGEDGKTRANIDTWHCRKAHQVHRSFLKQEANADSASVTSLIDWIDNEGAVFAKEERTMTFSFQGKDIVVDFDSTLKSEVPEIRLDGDPQHAGFQFRAHNDVNDKTKGKTYYIRPETGAAKPGQTINWSAKNDTDATRDLPWKAMCFELDDKVYTVAYLDSPENPKPARFSERDYGRFGSYFMKTVTKQAPLTIDYRLVIRAGTMTPEEVAALSKDFTTN